MFRHHGSLLRIVSLPHHVFQIIVCCSAVFYSIKSKSYWHLNTALLGDKCFKEGFKSFWDVFKTTKNSFRTLQQWWDFGKVQIKQFCQQYFQNVTREVALILNILEADILKLQE